MAIETRPELRAEFLQLLGEPRKALEELQAFGRSADKFDREEEELTRQHPEQWVAYKDGTVIAASRAVDDVLALVDAIGPGARNGMMLRFLTDDPMPMLL